jgi:hypothetical protein
MHIVLVVKIAELEDGGMSLLEGREGKSIEAKAVCLVRDRWGYLRRHNSKHALDRDIEALGSPRQKRDKITLHEYNHMRIKPVYVFFPRKHIYFLF